MKNINPDLLSLVQTILLEKRQMVIVDFLKSPMITNKIGSQANLALTSQVNLESLGYSYNMDFIKALSNLSKEEVVEVSKKVQDVIKTSIGAHRKFNPMYPNFPQQVIEASDLELFINAIIHYTGDMIGLRLLPHYKKETRKELGKKDLDPKYFDYKKELTTIKFGETADIVNLFRAMITSNTSLSETDKEVTATLFKFIRKSDLLTPLLEDPAFVIPQKENLILFASYLYGKKKSIDKLDNLFKTPTDVLRFAVMIGSEESDISLATKPKFKTISRIERRNILSLLDKVVANIGYEHSAEEMYNRREVWLRLGEKLHSGDYKSVYPNAFNAFHTIRNVAQPMKYLGKVDNAITTGQFEEAIELLAQKPGVLARNLNRVVTAIEAGNLSVSNTKKVIDILLNTLGTVADKISTPVLLQSFNYFKEEDKKAYRVFLPKGNLAKSYVIDNKTAELATTTKEAITATIRKTLVDRFSTLPALGKVYVDEALKTQNTPFAMRSASKALRTVARGSRIDIDDKETNRFFLWWKEAEGDRADIDISMLFLDKNYNKVDHCSFTNLKGQGFTHSGDITSAPKGACEFIDIDKSKLDSRIKYAALVMHAYTGQDYCDLPECFAGWMSREKAQKGEIFDPRTVQNKFDLASEGGCVMPMVIDIKNKQMIWTDLSLKASDSWSIIERVSEKVKYALKGMESLIKPNLYDLFQMHAEARGTLVNSISEADTVFSLYEGITPFQYEVIASDYMADVVKPINKPKVK